MDNLEIARRLNNLNDEQVRKFNSISEVKLYPSDTSVSDSNIEVISELLENMSDEEIADNISPLLGRKLLSGRPC